MRMTLTAAIAAMTLTACGGGGTGATATTSADGVSKAAFVNSCTAYYSMSVELANAPTKGNSRTIHDTPPRPDDIEGGCACLFDTASDVDVDALRAQYEKSGLKLDDSAVAKAGLSRNKTLAKQHANYLAAVKIGDTMSAADDYDMLANRTVSKNEAACSG